MGSSVIIRVEVMPVLSTFWLLYAINLMPLVFKRA